MQKATAVPTAAEAEENVMYLVKNEKTGHYDIYVLIDGAVEWLDDTTIDLDDVAGDIYVGTKTDKAASDSSVIDAFFAEDDAPVIKKGDVFVVNTVINGEGVRKVLVLLQRYGMGGHHWLRGRGQGHRPRKSPAGRRFRPHRQLDEGQERHEVAGN